MKIVAKKKIFFARNVFQVKKKVCRDGGSLKTRFEKLFEEFGNFFYLTFFLSIGEVG